MEKSESDDYEESLKKNDFETLMHRKIRLERIANLKTLRIPTSRISDYYEEAKTSFINGCFRSCIICSALAVEQVLKHTLIFQSEDWEETYWELEVKKIGFHKIIQRAEKSSPKLKKVLKDADWLRRARNEVAAHPLYVANLFGVDRKTGYLKMKETDEAIWASKIMFRDIRKLLRFLEPSKAREIKEKKWSARTTQGKILEEFPVKDFARADFLKQRPIDFTTFMTWYATQSEIIEEVAFNAYRRMVEIINSIS